MWPKFKWDMFFTSFLPLWLSIVIIDISSVIVNVIKMEDRSLLNFLYGDYSCVVQIISFIVILILSIVSIKGVNDFIKERKSDTGIPKGKILAARKARTIATEFLVAYILPMIAFDFTNIVGIILFVIYFGTLSFLSMRNNNIYTNLLLELKGFKIYYCDFECEKLGEKVVYKDSLIISSVNLTQNVNNDLEYWDFENDIYLILEGENINE